MAQVEVDVGVGGLDEPQREGIGLAHASPLFFLLLQSLCGVSVILVQ